MFSFSSTAPSTGAPATGGMSFGSQAPQSTFGGFSTGSSFAPAASAAPAPAAAPAAAAPAPTGPPTQLDRAAMDLYDDLLQAVHDAWNGSGSAEQLRLTLQQHLAQMARIDEEAPSASARSALESRNIECNGHKFDLSDARTVQFLLDLSSLLHVNELDAVRLCFQSAASLSSSDPSFGKGSASVIEDSIRTRAVELFFKRRFNLLLATLDLVLLEREGGDAGADENSMAVQRVVSEAVAELVRGGLTRNVMNYLESMQKNSSAAAAAAAAPSASAAPSSTLLVVSAHHGRELSYLLRLLFALFKPSGSGPILGAGQGVAQEAEVGSEDLIKLVELIQNRSTALHNMEQQQEAQQKQQQQQAGNMFGAQPVVAAVPAGAEHVATFQCYVLLFTLMESLEVKYAGLASSQQAGARASAGPSSAAAAAAAANADQDLFQFVRTLSRSILTPANWSHNIFRSGTLLVWSLFLKRVKLLYPGGDASGISENEEDITNMVLEGLGGSENEGFFIHLYQTVQNNRAFASWRKKAQAVAGGATTNMGDEEGEEGGAAAEWQSTQPTLLPSSATALGVSLSSSTSTSGSLLEELGDVLGEFLHHVLLLHSKEMDMLRKEGMSQMQHFNKQRQRLMQQLAAQQQQQQQQQFGTAGMAAAGLNLASVLPPHLLSELPSPPLLGFSSFLRLLSVSLRVTPRMSGLLWSNPILSAFLSTEFNEPMLGGAAAAAGSGANAANTSGAGAAPLHASDPHVFNADSPFLTPYLEVLSALCVDSSSALQVYLFVRGCSRLNWEFICISFFQHTLLAHYLPAPRIQNNEATMTGFDALRRGYGNTTQLPLRQQAATPPPPLPPRLQSLLSSFLVLLSSLLRHCPPLQSLFVSHPDFHLLDTSFSLLGVSLPVHIKARVVDLIAAMARLNADIAVQVWERLERSQMLPTQQMSAAANAVARGTGAQAPLEGLLYDLEEIENQQQVYPLSTAFVHLLVTLGDSTPLPLQMGEARGAASTGVMSAPQLMSATPTSTPGLAPYVSFVLSHLFLNLPYRSYLNPARDQFVLAELCITFFHRLVGDFIQSVKGMTRVTGGSGAKGAQGDTFQARHLAFQFAAPTHAGEAQAYAPSNLQSLSAHPAYPLLRDLFLGKEVLTRLLTVLSQSYSLLRGEDDELSTQVDPDPAVEGSLLAAIKFVWSMVEQEEQLVETLQHMEDIKSGETQRAATLLGRFTPISTWLLQHSPAVLTLCEAVGYIQCHPLTSVQQLERDKEACTKSKKNEPAGSTLLSTTLLHNATTTNQSMYEPSEEDEDAMLMAAAAAAESVPEESDAASEARTTQVAFYAASCLLFLSQRDQARVVHLLEASGLSGRVVLAFQKQLHYVILPDENQALSEADAPADPDLACNRARLVIMDLLLSSLQGSTPSNPHLSLALLLLGFDISTPQSVRSSDLLRSPRNQLLEELLMGQAIKTGFATRFPALANSVFQLLYQLMVNNLTSGSVMKFIQNHPATAALGQASGSGSGSVAQYLVHLLRSLPLVSGMPHFLRDYRLIESNLAGDKAVPALMRSSTLSSRVYHTLFHLSWIMRAINLHYFSLVSAQARARVATAMGANTAEEWRLDEQVELYLRALGFLTDDEQDNKQAGQAAAPVDWMAAGAQSTTGFISLLGGGGGAATRGASSHMLMLGLLANLQEMLATVLPASFQLAPPPSTVSAPASSSSSSATSTGAAKGGVFDLTSTRYFDAQHHAFQYSISDVYAGCLYVAGLSPEASYQQARACLEWNIVSSVFGVSKQAFDAWKQSVQVVLLTNSGTGWTNQEPERTQQLLVRMMQALLHKMAPTEEGALYATSSSSASSLSIWAALGEELSGLLLSVFVKLRELCLASWSRPGAPLSSAMGGSTLELQGLLPPLLSALLASRHAATRTNLYTVLLHYLLHAKQRKDNIRRAIARSAQPSDEESSTVTWQSLQQEQLSLDSHNLSLLSTHNHSLLSCLVNDAVDGSSKLRQVCFRLLSILMLGAAQDAATAAAVAKNKGEQGQGVSRFFGASERNDDEDSAVLSSSYTASCLALFGKHNLLLLFLNQLKAQDTALQAAIQSSGARALHGYELLLNTDALLSFFVQLASSGAAGATMLLEHQVVRVLGSLMALQTRPHGAAGAYGAEFNNGNKANAAANDALLTPQEKFDSLYLSVLRLLVSLLDSLPSHTLLLRQVQQFFFGGGQGGSSDLLQSIFLDAAPIHTDTSLDILSTACSLLYHMIKEERAMTAGQQGEQQQKKGQKGAAREDASSSSTPFTAFFHKHVRSLLHLLSRFFRPFSDVRLRRVLQSKLRAKRDRMEAALGGSGAGMEDVDATMAEEGGDDNPASGSGAGMEGEDALLQHGTPSMQTIFRKIMAICTLEVTPAAGATAGAQKDVIFFGPYLGEGVDRYGDDFASAGAHDAYDAAQPQLELLLSILQEKHTQLLAAQRQLFTLHKNLDLLNHPHAASANPSEGSVASTLAALELEYFPPSAASSFFYDELDASQRRVHLRRRIQSAISQQRRLVEGQVWSMEHALMLLFHHVRVYLPASSLAHKGVSLLPGANTNIAPSEFRAQAEAVVVPLLTHMQHTFAEKREMGGRAGEQQRNGREEQEDQSLQLYAPVTSVALAAPLARFSGGVASSSPANAFITAMLQRTIKHISG